MITKEQYDVLEKKYGDVASWAVWRMPGSSPKSYTSDMTVFDDKDLHNILNPGVVFVGLNGSSTHGNWMGDTYRPWLNFHSGYSYQNDYKLRYALMGSEYWGAYITDIIKHYPEVNSSKVCDYLSDNPDVIKKNVEIFLDELSHLDPNPLIVAMGGKTYDILTRYLPKSYRIVKITHYSFTIGQEKYREHVLSVLNGSATPLLIERNEQSNLPQPVPKEKVCPIPVKASDASVRKSSTRPIYSAKTERYEELCSALLAMGYDLSRHHFDINVKINGKIAIAVYVAKDSYKIYTNHIEWMEKSQYVGDLDEYGYTHYHVPTFEECVREICDFAAFLGN